MDTLNENILLIIIKELNLNQRAPLRLVNKKFRDVCDSVMIENLFVMERKSVLPNELKRLVGDEFTMIDTVKVENTRAFFNKKILSQMKSIKKLKIKGYCCTKSIDSINIDVSFDELEYLSISHIHLINAEIFKSPKIKNLSLEFVKFNFYDNMSSSYGDLIANSAFYRLGFFELKTTKLTKLQIKDTYLAMEFFDNCLKYNLFHNLKELDVYLIKPFLISDHSCCPNNVLIFLSRNCPSLKTIKVSFFQQDYKEIVKEDLRYLTDELRSVIDSKQVSTVQSFLKDFAKSIDLDTGKPVLIYHELTFRLINEYHKKIDLTGFYKLVKCIFLAKHLQLPDINIFGRFVNCVSLRIQFPSKPDNDFSRYLKALPNLKSIHVYNSNQCIAYGNNLLDNIPYCDRIQALIIESPGKIDLKFLLKLPRLKFLQMALFHPICCSLIFEFVKNLKNLEVVDVSFIKPDTLHRKELSQFKRLIIGYHTDELKSDDFDFRIQIHDVKVCEIVRFVLKKGYFKTLDFKIKEVEDQHKNRKKELVNMFNHSQEIGVVRRNLARLFSS